MALNTRSSPLPVHLSSSNDPVVVPSPLDPSEGPPPPTPPQLGASTCLSTRRRPVHDRPSCRAEQRTSGHPKVRSHDESPASELSQDRGPKKRSYAGGTAHGTQEGGALGQHTPRGCRQSTDPGSVSLPDSWVETLSGRHTGTHPSVGRDPTVVERGLQVSSPVVGQERS